ncbi:MAG TPA: beta-1,3-glucanase family protein [Candidatus Cybelea sp.]|nr:beta-1,3-glucanase family protein [Candidatus Cybelea sp.]
MAYTLGICAAIIMLAGCGGSQIGAPIGMQQNGLAALHSGRANFPLQNPDAETIPLTIVNSTGNYANKNVYFLLYGQGVAPDKKWYHVVNAAGKMKLCTSTNGKYSADYSFNLAKVSTIQIPTMRAARLYISFNKKLLLIVNEKGVPSPPKANNSHASNVNYNTIWDFVEWTYNPAFPKGSGWNGNITNVDATNIAMQFNVVGSDETGKRLDLTSGMKPGDYSMFRASLQGNPDFKNLILPKTQRVLSPADGIASEASPGGPVFSPTYLDDYLNKVWTKYETDSLTMETNLFGQWAGQVKGGELVFTQQNGSPKLDPVVFSKPTTLQAFANDNICVSGCKKKGEWQQEDVNNQLRSAFLAAIMRSTLLTDTTIGIKYESKYCKESENFYQATTTNVYAKYLHANALEGRAYGFGFDDTCDQSSFRVVRIPKKLTVKLVRD